MIIPSVTGTKTRLDLSKLPVGCGSTRFMAKSSSPNGGTFKTENHFSVSLGRFESDKSVHKSDGLIRLKNDYYKLKFINAYQQLLTIAIRKCDQIDIEQIYS